MKKQKKRPPISPKQFGMTVLSAFLRNAPLLAAGVVLVVFSSFLGKTPLYIGVSLCIAYLLSCLFQIVFESTSRGSKFADMSDNAAAPKPPDAPSADEASAGSDTPNKKTDR